MHDSQPLDGRFIVLVGPDGSGKSTVSSRLVSGSQQQVTPLNFRPRRIDAWLGKRPPQGGSESEPHQIASTHPLRTWFKFAVIVADLVTVRWDVWRARRAGRAFIAERYVYDLLADPKRLGLETIPAWLRALAVRAVATPVRVYCLVGSPELMHRRKPELPLAEVARQTTFWETYASRRRNFVCIDSTQAPIDALVKMILDDLQATA